MKNVPVLFDLFNSYSATSWLENAQQKLEVSIGQLQVHHFPDQEIVIRIASDVQNTKVIFLCSLDRPNAKLAALFFAAETVRELGAAKVGLVAPYLAYMRQDKQFNPQEGITSKYFARMISNYFDWMVTLDPHLHRWKNLSDIYSIPTQVLHAHQPIAEWIKRNVVNPVLIGPDSESSQWVEAIAQIIQAPVLVLNKTRVSDTKVIVSLPEIEAFKNHTPVLIDDIISTATTMLATIQHLQTLNLKAPICIGVHAVFAQGAYEKLNNSGAAQIVTCNTIPHLSNAIDISSILIQQLVL